MAAQDEARSENAPHEPAAVLLLIDVSTDYKFPSGKEFVRQALPMVARLAASYGAPGTSESQWSRAMITLANSN